MRRIFLVIGLGVIVGTIVAAFIFYNSQSTRVANLVQPRGGKTEVTEPSSPDSGTVAGTAAVESQPSTSIVVVGDIMLGRNVEGWMDKQGLDYPFVKIQSSFADADFVLANLEGPIRKRHTRTPTGSTTFNFMPEVAGALKSAGFTTLSLANNHTLDYGPASLEETRQYLREAGLEFFGHPREIKDSFVLRKEVKGRKLAFIGLQDVFASMDNKQAVALVKLVATEPETIAIVSIHWGDEYKLVANQRQKKLAHDFVDAGADVIIGHHPHVVQNIELYKDRPIFYSLGNFVFDQYFSKETQESLMLKLEFDSSDLTVRLYPVDIIKSQPILMEEPSTKIWLQKLAEQSQPALSAQIKQGTMVVPR